MIVVTIDQDKHLESESKYLYTRTVPQGSQECGMSQEEDTETGSPTGNSDGPPLTSMLAVARHNGFQIKDQRAQSISLLQRYHPVSTKYCAFLHVAIRIIYFSSMAVPEITCVSETPIVLLPSDAPVDDLYCSLSAMATPDTLNLQPVVLGSFFLGSYTIALMLWFYGNRQFRSEVRSDDTNSTIELIYVLK
jgi:hypothetical protein